MKGLAELLILQRLFRTIRDVERKKGRQMDELPLPCEYFDLIGGTSTGGYALCSGYASDIRLRTCQACGDHARTSAYEHSRCYQTLQDTFKNGLPRGKALGCDEISKEPGGHCLLRRGEHGARCQEAT